MQKLRSWAAPEGALQGLGLRTFMHSFINPSFGLAAATTAQSCEAAEAGAGRAPSASDI